jgi:hypothetical protein
MGGRVNLCPVCCQAVKPTLRHNIPAHLDSIRTDTCPGTGEPFRIAVTVTPEFQVVTA